MEDLKIGLLPVVIEAGKDEHEHFMPETNRRLNDILLKNLSGFGKIFNAGITANIEEAWKARKKLISQDVDIIVIVNMHYTPSEVPLTVIKGMNKPVIVLNASLIRGFKPEDKISRMSTEHGIVGSIELASLLKRIEYPKYYLVSGLMDNDITYKKLAPILKAAQVKKTLENTNIGYIGSTVYTGMLDIEADETLLKAKLGLNIIHLKRPEILDAINSITKKEIDSKRKDIGEKYNLDDIEDKDLLPSIRLMAAYRKLVDKYSITSVANYCQTTMYDPDIGFPPCLATSVLTAEGIPFSCEGDLGNAISMLILKHLTGNAAFAETYILDYDKNSVLLAHCGQGNLAYAKSQNDVCIRSHGIFVDAPLKGAASNFSYKEGEATLLNISTDNGCKMKMVISKGKLGDYEPADFGVPQGWYDPGMELDTFVEKWMEAGPTHHAALGYGDVSDVLAKLADMLDMNIYMI